MANGITPLLSPLPMGFGQDPGLISMLTSISPSGGVVVVVVVGSSVVVVVVVDSATVVVVVTGA
jgi:hypothetical protein